MRASSQSGLSAIVPLPVSVTPDAAFEPLAGEPPLVRIVRSLLGVLPGQSDVLVAATERLVGDVRGILTGAGLRAVGVVTVEGSASRARCLGAGLDRLSAEAVRQVLVHDIRQPLIPTDLLNRVVARLTGGDPVVLPTVPVTDSVKAVDEHGTVTATLDRSTLQVVQYPRGFAVERLASLLAEAADADFDEADAAVRARMPVTTTDGDAEAFLADLPRDAMFVEAVIGSRVR
ncbi:2-C-methyl-D-erythritol 4-phosphate cytidylyltransferase [Mycobacterium sp. B14F4]|uniref:IspD/TarI family cytidylyltransferase n=1 Tax=Mycobacterium sp. B14F4 TaxID=3153565 RepID=UPI00325F59EE